MDVVKVFLVALCCLHQNILINAYDECSSIAFVSTESQYCISVLAVLNQTAGHTQDDVCRAYNEVARCIQLRAMKINGECSLTAFHKSFTKMAGYSSDSWISNMNTNLCTLIQFNTSICSSPERIGHVLSEACMKAILSGFNASNSNYICASIAGLEACAENFLGSLGEKCTLSEIKHGLQSETATDWMRKHYSSISLDECFSVYHAGQAGHDSECRDINYISTHAQQSLGIVFMNNVTTVGKQVYCQTFYYALHLLQHEMEKEGHICDINDLYHELSTVLGYQGVDRAVLSSCSDVMRTSTSDFCLDQSMVFQIIANEPFCKPYIEHMANHPSACMYRDQFAVCAETKLHYAGFDCDIKSIFSPTKIVDYLKLHFPSEVVSDCS